MKNSIIKTALLMIFALSSNMIFAQEDVNQTIRGQVLDRDARYPLPGANVFIPHSDPFIGISTDFQGNFVLENIPVGRYDIAVSLVGYESRLIQNILVGSGKEIVLTIDLAESVLSLNEATIEATEEKSGVLNEMALVSARSVKVEETNRFAGAINDPARMVSGFAGVTGDAQGNNDIVVRGNSPTGVLWRLEGMDIPNPNHFSSQGSSGGAINALNSKMLSNSDFFTGAFTAQYGNVTSGVFDMRLRTGNNQNREYTVGFSVLGTDITAEGPFREGYGGSYLVNYRYSSLALLDQAGIVDYEGVPKYQDASYKIVLPTDGRSVFTAFGLWGRNGIDVAYGDEDDGIAEEKGSQNGGLNVFGFKQLMQIDQKNYLENAISFNSTKDEGLFDKYEGEGGGYTTYYQEEFINRSVILSSQLTHKFNAKHTLKSGIIARSLDYQMFSQYREEQGEPMTVGVNDKGSSYALQGYTTWRYRINESVTVTNGLHGMYYGVTGKYSVEPRSAVSWKINGRNTLSAGYGLHSKAENVATYFANSTDDFGNETQPNKNLDLFKSHHFVVGVDHWFNELLRLKTDLYIQKHFNVLVDADPTSEYTTLNSVGGFPTTPLSNNGEGLNYGMEVTLERAFDQGLYFMSTLSLFRSLYTPLNGEQRNSRFDSKYVANFIGGKEWAVGDAAKKKTIGLNTKVALMGAVWYTPVDLEASIEAGREVLTDDYMSGRGDDVLKIDVSFIYRRERPNSTHEFKMDLQNVTNNTAKVDEYYDSMTESLQPLTQLSLLPVVSYSINF